MTIAELLAATGLTANDLVPIWDAEAAQNVEPTQKVTAAQLAAAVKVLASLVNTTEMNTAIQQSTASIDYYELLVFSGTSEATVSLGKIASDFDLINFILVDSNGVRVAAAMTTVVQAHNATFKLYGESSSQWGSVRISDDYTKATCNRTSSNTSQLRIIGIKYR